MWLTKNEIAKPRLHYTATLKESPTQLVHLQTNNTPRSHLRPPCFPMLLRFFWVEDEDMPFYFFLLWSKWVSNKGTFSSLARCLVVLDVAERCHCLPFFFFFFHGVLHEVRCIVFFFLNLHPLPTTHPIVSSLRELGCLNPVLPFVMSRPEETQCSIYNPINVLNYLSKSFSPKLPIDRLLGLQVQRHLSILDTPKTKLTLSTAHTAHTSCVCWPMGDAENDYRLSTHLHTLFLSLCSVVWTQTQKYNQLYWKIRFDNKWWSKRERVVSDTCDVRYVVCVWYVRVLCACVVCVCVCVCVMAAICCCFIFLFFVVLVLFVIFPLERGKKGGKDEEERRKDRVEWKENRMSKKMSDGL